MKVAVIADVHGNSWALEAVVESILSESVDATVNLGDTVYGPLDPHGTAAILRSTAYPTVRGNQDRLLLELDRPINPTIEFVMGELTESDISWLSALPTRLVIAETLLLFHASPGNDQECFLETITETGVLDRADEEIEDALQEYSQSWVACAHSHVPKIRTLRGGTTVVNPGSVGLPAYSDDRPFFHRMESGTPHAKYALLDLDRPGSVELRSVAYAWETAARRASELAREDWASAIRTGRTVMEK